MKPSPELAQLIGEKKALYCRYLDTQKWHLFDQVMLPDVKWKFASANEGLNQSFASRDAFVTHFSELFKPLQSIHVIGTAEMEQVCPDEIKAIFAGQWSSGPQGEGAQGHMSGGGYYHEVWKRVGEDWLMAECEVELTYLVTRQ